ncbi:MAG: hypothetical protein H7330_14795, partial [Hymenobacteraceae bacterium]|nr:hypothetical protein [Hymenobacteraceae bacterium]
MTAASRIVSFFLLGLLGFLSVPATAQAWRWAQRPTGARGQSAAVATVITATGESYFAYVHQDSLTLGTQTFPGPVVSPGQYITNTVIARYDAAGAVVGFALVGTAAAVEDLELDAAGNLYATGHFSGQLTSGTSALTALGTYDLFVAKWNAAGTIQWLKQGRRQLDNIQQHSQVAIDGAGNVTIAAGFRDSVTFDGHTVTADSGQNTLVVAQYDASGAFRWAKATTGHAPSVVISDLAAAPNGTLHLVGTCYSGFVWDTKPVPPFTGAISYWLKLDVNGQMLDAERFGNLYSYYPQVATDATGAAYIACSSPVLYSTWGDVPLPVPANAESHFSVIRLTPAGTPQWVRTAWVPLGPQGSANIVENTSLRVVSDLPGDGGGDVRVYLGGRFITPDSAVMTCGPFTLHTDRRRLFDGYLLALDGLSGRPAWLLPVGSGPRNEFVSSLGANAAGELTVSGFFMGDTSYFGNTYLLNGPATYIAKLAQRYNLLQGTTFQDPNTNGRRDAGESALESVVVAAEPGPTYFTTSSTGQYSAVADLGTYTLSIPNPPRYHTAVASGSATASFSSYGNVSTGHDFAIQGIPGQQDLQVFVTPMSRARPGFAVSYRLTARNVGTVPVAAGNLRLTIPETLLAYVSSTPAGTHAGSTTSWA